MKQTVVVTGADNFLGRRVVASLLASDWAAPVAIATGDDHALRRAIAGAAAIAHCVGGAARDIDRGASALYSALAGHAPVPRVVHISSMTVYGSATGWIDESAGIPDNLGPYARAQLQAETRARNHGDIVVLRPGAEYGPGCPYWSGQIARWLQSHRLGDLGPAGDGFANLVYIDDLVAAVLVALRLPGIAGETFNIAQAEKPTWNEYFSAFALALGAVPVRRIPGRRLQMETQLLAPPLKIAQLSMHALRLPQSRLPSPISPSLLRLCGQEIRLNATRAERILNMCWTPLVQGLQRAASA